jgi:hypothetical protein
MEEGAAPMIERYLNDLAYQVNSFRLKSMYRGQLDNDLKRMDNALMLAYNAWHHNSDAESALGHLESVQSTCVERLTAVFRTKYNTCVALLRAELSRSSTPEPDHQHSHIAVLLQLLKSYISVETASFP